MTAKNVTHSPGHAGLTASQNPTAMKIFFRQYYFEKLNGGFKK
jgi:hypothetical protein